MEDKLAALDANLREQQAKKQKLESDVALCARKIERATQLVSGLGGEKVRWTKSAESYGKLYTKLTGDVLLSSGVIAYLGAFTPLFREECARDWARRCREKGLPCSDEFTLAAVLADPVKVGGRDARFGWRTLIFIAPPYKELLQEASSCNGSVLEKVRSVTESALFFIPIIPSIPCTTQ